MLSRTIYSWIPSEQWIPKTYAISIHKEYICRNTFLGNGIHKNWGTQTEEETTIICKKKASQTVTTIDKTSRKRGNVN